MSRWTDDEICRLCGTGVEHHTGRTLECPGERTSYRAARNANPMGLVGFPTQWPPPRVTNYEALSAAFGMALAHSKRMGRRMTLKPLPRPSGLVHGDPGWLITPTDTPSRHTTTKEN